MINAAILYTHIEIHLDITSNLVHLQLLDRSIHETSLILLSPMTKCHPSKKLIMTTYAYQSYYEFKRLVTI